MRDGGDLSAVFHVDIILAISLAREMVEGSPLDPDRWRRAVQLWGPDAAMDLVLSVAHWGGLIPIVLSAFGFTTEHVGTGSIS